MFCVALRRRCTAALRRNDLTYLLLSNYTCTLELDQTRARRASDPCILLISDFYLILIAHFLQKTV